MKKIALLLLLLTLTLTGLSCNLFKQKSEQTETTTTSDEGTLLTATTNSVDAVFQANWQTAKSKVKDWHSDAVISAVNIKLPKDLLADKAVETFVFGSASDTANWWTFAVSENSGKFVRAIVPKEDYLSDVSKPIDEKFWKINYLEALQIADANGGKTFRANNQDVQIALTLSQTQPKGWLWWLAEYKAANGETLKVRINASDKTVVDDSGNVVSK